DGVIANCYLALIYARVGEKDLAFPLLERLLKTPGAVDSVDYSVTINDLKHRWGWDPVRSDPRFQKLLEQRAKRQNRSFRFLSYWRAIRRAVSSEHRSCRLIIANKTSDWICLPW